MGARDIVWLAGLGLLVGAGCSSGDEASADEGLQAAAMETETPLDDGDGDDDDDDWPGGGGDDDDDYPPGDDDDDDYPPGDDDDDDDPPGDDDDDDEGGSDEGGSDDGGSDDGVDCEPTTWYPDSDGDGFGAEEAPVEACDPPPGHTANGGDCDDGNAERNPFAVETCDSVDNDCNGLVDELSDENTSNGCNLAERAGHYYWFCGVTSTWPGAEATCDSLGGSLMTIDDALEQQWLTGQPLPNVGFGYWIGGNDLAAEGSFEWTDGTPLLYTNWVPGEPNDANGNEDCVAWAGLWNDVPCNDPSFAFVCEA